MVWILDKLIRKYAEEEGREYTDRSRLIRQGIRAMFLKGQQLWDDDMKNNFEMWGWWNPRDAIWRKYQNIVARPEFYSPSIRSWINDPTHVDDIPGGADNTVYYNQSGMEEPAYLPPLPGKMVYVKADRNVCYFNGSIWQPILRFDDHDRSIEISFCMGNGAMKKGKICAVYVVEKPFMLLANSREGRCRGTGIYGVTIQKNGSPIGYAVYVASSRVQINADIAFAPGDRLELVAPLKGGFSDPCNVSILGKLLYD